MSPLPEPPDEATLERDLREAAQQQDALLAVERQADGWEAEFRLPADIPGGPHDGIALIGGHGATRYEALWHLHELVQPTR